MKQGVTAEQERACLDTQAHIVKGKIIKQCLTKLLENGLMQLEELDEELEKATQTNRPEKRSVIWGETTRQRKREKGECK